MWEDPIVLEVRRIREELSGRFNFDVDAIFEDMRKRQTTLGSINPSRTMLAASSFSLSASEYLRT